MADVQNKSPTLKLTGMRSQSSNLYGVIRKARMIYEYDYEKITNKPSIETIELVGDKKFEELGIRSVTNAELAQILK